MKKDIKELGQEKILKLLIKYAIPTILGNVVFAMQTLIDRIFIGRGIGSLALSGVSVLVPIVPIMASFTVLFGVGAGVRISIKLGENNKDDAEKILGNIFTVILLASVLVICSCLIWFEPFIRLLGASDLIFEDAKNYLLFLLPSVLFTFIFISLQKPINSSGNPKFVFLTIVACTTTNIILDAIFIVGLKMGVIGAAIATDIANFVPTVMVLVYFTRGHSLIKLRLKNLKLEKHILLPALAVGMAPFSWFLGVGIVFAITIKSLALYGGDLAIGAMGIINTISSLIIMVIVGLDMGSQPIIGYNYGAKAYGRVRETLRWAMMIVGGITTIIWMFVMFAPGYLILLFNQDEELVRIGIQGMRIYLMMIILVGIQVVGADFFQAVGKSKPAILLGVLRRILLYLPCLLVLPHFYGLTGIWMAAPIADSVSTIITIAFLLKELKKQQTYAQKVTVEEPISAVSTSS